eukprot:768088-Hanusia_phi.AAC.2
MLVELVFWESEEGRMRKIQSGVQGCWRFFSLGILAADKKSATVTVFRSRGRVQDVAGSLQKEKDNFAKSRIRSLCLPSESTAGHGGYQEGGPPWRLSIHVSVQVEFRSGPAGHAPRVIWFENAGAASQFD